jgi:Tol biopolymer transport system component
MCRFVFPVFASASAIAQSTSRVSVDSSGAQGDSLSGSPSTSADGRYVAFQSFAANVVPGDTNQCTDVFVRDLLTGLTTRVSVSSSGAQGNLHSIDPAISADGRFVAFSSQATNLIPVDTNNALPDIFVHDRQTGTTVVVSISSLGVQGTGFSYHPSISADGRYVAFESDAYDLVPIDPYPTNDIFVHDLQTGETTLISISHSGSYSDRDSWNGSISADGRWVSFDSSATNLVPGGGTPGDHNVYVRDRENGVTTRVSVDPSGGIGNGYSGNSSISADGRFIAFRSFATNLVPGGSNGYLHVYLRDQVTATTMRCSVSSAGAQGIGDSIAPSISADGRDVAFESTAINLVLGDTNGFADIFVRDRGADLPLSFCLGDGSGAACPCGNSGAVGHGCENSAASGGALLTATGASSLSADTLVLHSSGELPSALSIFLQGGDAVPPVNFGDGVRCAGGALHRLYTKHASAGTATAPQVGDASVSLRSAILGDPIPLGASRFYQTYYRDPSATFCPAPSGGSFNVSSALAVVWSL